MKKTTRFVSSYFLLSFLIFCIERYTYFFVFLFYYYYFPLLSTTLVEYNKRCGVWLNISLTIKKRQSKGIFSYDFYVLFYIFFYFYFSLFLFLSLVTRNIYTSTEYARISFWNSMVDVVVVIAFLTSFSHLVCASI